MNTGPVTAIETATQRISGTGLALARRVAELSASIKAQIVMRRCGSIVICLDHSHGWRRIEWSFSSEQAAARFQSAIEADWGKEVLASPFAGIGLDGAALSATYNDGDLD